jgi:membrane fusion protein (multidrug efflux system)
VEQVKKAELNQAKADLSAAKSKLAYTNIVSPINGVVGSLPYKIGSLVSSTSETALTTIANTKQIYAYFSLSQQQLGAFLNQYDGQQINEKFKHMPQVSLLMQDGELYNTKGKIETLSGVLNASTGAANFKAVFPNPEAKLWSGASATIRIPTQLNDAIMVPKSTTFELQGKYFVFKVDQKNIVHHTAIDIMEAVTDKNYVVTKGLAAGDQIVTEGLGNLKDGMKIKPNPSTPK